MKKVLISNNQQINFLNSLKDSNIKMAKDNEELIHNLKDTISELNTINLENNNKIDFLMQENDKMQKYKKEIESYKLISKNKEKIISSFKTLFSILIQNLDNILKDNPNIIKIDIEKNEDNERIIHECELKLKEIKEKIENNKQKIKEILENNTNLETEKKELKIKFDENVEKCKKINNNYEMLNKKYEEQNKQIEILNNKIRENDKEIKDKNIKNEELNKKIINKVEELNKIIVGKDNEIKEIKNEIDENKKLIEELNQEIDKKSKEIEKINKIIEEKNNIIKIKNNEIEVMKIEMDKKNNAINEKQNQIDLKNKEIEKMKKQIDLQITKMKNLDYFEKVKQFEIDIKNKDMKIEELQNSLNIDKNKIINNIKENKEIKGKNIENTINYKDYKDTQQNNDIIINKENQNIYTETNNINYLTKKILYKNNIQELKEKEKEKDKDKKYTIFKDISNIKTNFDYNNYKDKNEFLSESINNEKDKKDIKGKDNLKKEQENLIINKYLNKDKFENNISTYREKRPKNININYNENKDIYNDYKNKNKNTSGEFNIDYSKTENNKNNINIKNYDNYNLNDLNKMPETNNNINININKEPKMQMKHLKNNKKEEIKNENFEKQRTTINKNLLNLINTNEEDINIPKTNSINIKNDDLNKYMINNHYNDKNDEINNNIILTSSSISQNDDIKNIKYIENTERKKNQQFTYIYSLIGTDLISFNLKEKNFEIITINDNTGGIFNSYIIYYQENNLFPQLLNTPNGFYILLHKYIFTYNQIDNSITKLIKLISNHINGNFINIIDDIYSISGNNTTQCEKYSLISKNNTLIPSTNFPRINSGICNINNEYIYLFFGKISNSIERLYIGKKNNYNCNYNDKWEIININEKIGFDDDNNYLNKFVSFLDDYNNIIIFGGEDYNGKENKNIFGFNLKNKNISIIGKIDSCSLYLNQFITLDESIFSIYDMNNGLHFFNKELDYHEIFNLNP